MGLFNLFKKKTEERKVSSNLISEKQKVNIQMSIQTDSKNNEALDELIKTAFPSRNNGLYPHEILVLAYAEMFYTEGNDYQRFWRDRYSITDVDEILHSLLERGFLTKSSIIDTLQKKTVAALKEILSSNGLSLKGKKAELIQRLIDEIPMDELENLV
ncbi:MAG: SAP domain-containing protein, partial [Oscillospiraceae bacterium]|nr:SAP domain-containing protein [Oscillospiraceae bacterium]